MRWDELPGRARAGVQEILGAPMITSESRPGGFSHGTADRLRTTAGTTAFVKAIGTSMNGGAAGLHRQEAKIAAALPDGIPVPGCTACTMTATGSR